MDSEVEQALALATEIARDREALRKKEQLFASLFGLSKNAIFEKNGELTRLQIASSDTSIDSTAQRLRDFFRANPNREISIAEIRKRLPDIEPKLIRSTTHRLAGSKYGLAGLESVRRGVYQFDPEEERLL